MPSRGISSWSPALDIAVLAIESRSIEVQGTLALWRFASCIPDRKRFRGGLFGIVEQHCHHNHALRPAMISKRCAFIIFIRRIRMSS